MAKKRAKTKGQKRTSSNRRLGSGPKAAARRGAATRRTKNASRNTRRRTAAARTLAGKAARVTTADTGIEGGPKKRAFPAVSRKRRRVTGRTRRERELAPTPEPDVNVPTPPSSLNLDRSASAARSGRRELIEQRLEHTETGPMLTGGDIDANWEDAYSVGSEAPGGDNPTPDQDLVDDIGKALGIEYQDNEELKGADKIAQRDRRRWELDPASSDDYRDREK